MVRIFSNSYQPALRAHFTPALIGCHLFSLLLQHHEPSPLSGDAVGICRSRIEWLIAVRRPLAGRNWGRHLVRSMAIRWAYLRQMSSHRGRRVEGHSCLRAHEEGCATSGPNSTGNRYSRTERSLSGWMGCFRKNSSAR